MQLPPKGGLDAGESIHSRAHREIFAHHFRIEVEELPLDVLTARLNAFQRKKKGSAPLDLIKQLGTDPEFHAATLTQGAISTSAQLSGLIL